MRQGFHAEGDCDQVPAAGVRRREEVGMSLLHEDFLHSVERGSARNTQSHQKVSTCVRRMWLRLHEARTAKEALRVETHHRSRSSLISL